MLPCYTVCCGCVCSPGHIHCSCSTVMSLFYIHVSKLGSCAVSTRPLCPSVLHRNLCTCLCVQDMHALCTNYTTLMSGHLLKNPALSLPLSPSLSVPPSLPPSLPLPRALSLRRSSSETGPVSRQPSIATATEPLPLRKRTASRSWSAMPMSSATLYAGDCL